MLRGEILQTPAADLTGTKILGTVTDLAIREQGAWVKGLILRLRGAGRHTAFVPLEAIVSFGRDIILFSGQARRMQAAPGLDSACVLDLEGAFCGMAQDLDFDPASGAIRSLWIRRWALGERIEVLIPDPCALRRTQDGSFLLTDGCDPN